MPIFVGSSEVSFIADISGITSDPLLPGVASQRASHAASEGLPWLHGITIGMP